MSGRRLLARAGGVGTGGDGAGLLGRILGVAASVVVVVAAFTVSVVLVAVALTGALAGFGYLWWRTRALRRKLREQQARGPEARGPEAHGRVIEGEVIRDR